jgi:hypothetical protein
MGLKEFWELNKYSYLWSCLLLSMGVLFISMIKKISIQISSLMILGSLPIMFLMAFGINEFSKGSKE